MPLQICKRSADTAFRKLHQRNMAPKIPADAPFRPNYQVFGND